MLNLKGEKRTLFEILSLNLTSKSSNQKSMHAHFGNNASECKFQIFLSLSLFADKRALSQNKITIIRIISFQIAPHFVVIAWILLQNHSNDIINLEQRKQFAKEFELIIEIHIHAHILANSCICDFVFVSCAKIGTMHFMRVD